MRYSVNCFILALLCCCPRHTQEKERRLSTYKTTPPPFHLRNNRPRQTKMRNTSPRNQYPDLFISSSMPFHNGARKFAQYEQHAAQWDIVELLVLGVKTVSQISACVCEDERQCTEEAEEGEGEEEAESEVSGGRCRLTAQPKLQT